MSASDSIWTKLRSLFLRKRAERELDAEMRYDLTRRTEANIAAGLSPHDAKLAALREFGSVSLAMEECRDARGTRWLDQLWQDTRLALRTLRRDPAFAAVAILTLALGIGANTAIFSIVNTVLLRPFPFPNANRLVMVFGTEAKRGATHDVATYPNFADWRTEARSFAGLGAYSMRTAVLAGGDHAEVIHTAQVTPGLFEALGVAPALGRAFSEDEDKEGAAPVVILSDSYWHSRFGARGDVVGQTVRIVISSGPTAGKAATYTIIGVMPPGFSLTPQVEQQIYTPLQPDPDRGHGFLLVIGRLRDGISVANAQAEMNVISDQLAKQFPKFNEGLGANVQPFRQALTGDVRPVLLIFLGVVALVLLVACTNVANLVLARGAARQKELAVRAALGAGRARLAKQLLTESTVLALAGGAAGLVLGAWIAQGLAGMLGHDLNFPGLKVVHLDSRVALFTLALSFLTGIAFGLAPAFVSISTDLNESLRESGRSATAGVRGRKLRSFLVIAETALALVLLAGAGVLLKSLLILRSTAPGFDTRNLVVTDFSLPQDRFKDPEPRITYFTELLSRFREYPGVRSAALVADLPLNGGSDELGFYIVGRQRPGSDPALDAAVNLTSAGYFHTMGVPIRAGREFTDRDSASTPLVAVINDAAARKFWPNQNPIGQQIDLGKNAKEGALPLYSIVGVAADLRQNSLGEPPEPMIYLDFVQPSPAWPWLTLVVRTSSDSANQLGPIKSLAESVDRGVPVITVQTMDDVLSRSIAQPRVYAALLGAFALLALALAAVGLYGVVSYTVTQRTHEMGIRIAIGASRGDVLALVLKNALQLVGIGVAIGIAGAIGVTQLLTKLERTVQPGDPLTLIAVSVLMIAVALAAGFAPALRATRVDPITALRYE
jgi:predicted permease